MGQFVAGTALPLYVAHFGFQTAVTILLPNDSLIKCGMARNYVLSTRYLLYSSLRVT